MDELIVIPFSHYCEKARWGLQRAGRVFRERPALPGFHVPIVRRALRGVEREGDRHSSRNATPVLITKDGAIRGSTEILRWADPGFFEGEDVERWVARFDDELGPHARRGAYFLVFETNGVMQELADRNAPRTQALAFRFIRPFVTPLMRKSMRIDRAGFERSMAAVDAILGEVAELIADGRPFLTGDRMTAADLTFAALAAPLVLPEQYGAHFPDPSTLIDEGRAVVARYRAHPAGQFALRLYRENRQGS